MLSNRHQDKRNALGIAQACLYAGEESLLS